MSIFAFLIILGVGVFGSMLRCIAYYSSYFIYRFQKHIDITLIINITHLLLMK